MWRGPAPGVLLGAVWSPYSQAYWEVRLTVPTWVLPLKTASVVLVLSGMENRRSMVFVLALVVKLTWAPVWLSVTAWRPDASPEMSPIVRLGAVTAAPPATTPDSASYRS